MKLSYDRATDSLYVLFADMLTRRAIPIELHPT